MFERSLTLEVLPCPSSDPTSEAQEVDLRISQESQGSESVVVWDAALVLAYYLEKHQTRLFAGSKVKRVVELGSGTGVVGIVAAALGANTVISDLPEYLPLLKTNIDLNRDVLRGEIEAKKIVWGEDSLELKEEIGKIDFILVSDCVYYEASLKPLVSTLLELTEEKTEILISFEERESEQKQAVQKGFFKLIRAHFVVEEIPSFECHPQYSCPEIRVLRLRREREQ